MLCARSLAKVSVQYKKIDLLVGVRGGADAVSFTKQRLSVALLVCQETFSLWLIDSYFSAPSHQSCLGCFERPQFVFSDSPLYLGRCESSSEQANSGPPENVHLL